jgi:hypothetical protein
LLAVLWSPFMLDRCTSDRSARSFASTLR